MDVEVQHLATNAVTGALVNGWVYAGENPILRFEGAPGAEVVSYYLEDASDSVAALLNAGGAVVEEYEFDGFGNSLNDMNPTSAAGGDFGYHGAWRDAETGLYHMRARTYDPQTGRFTTPDPATPNPQVPESYEPYSFANNNPHLYSDPTGLFSIAEINVTSSIQSSLRNLKNIAVQAAKEYAKDEIKEALAESLISGLTKVIPANGILGPVFSLLNSGLDKKAGSIFGAFVQKTICDAFQAPSWIFFEPGVYQNTGKPSDDGFNCHHPRVGDADFSFRVPTPSTQGPRRRPDMILGNSRPYKDQVQGGGGDNWTVLEVKLSTAGLASGYKNGGYAEGQLEAIAKYTHKYTITRSIAVFVTLFQGGKNGQNWQANLAKFREHATREGLATVVLSLTGNNRRGRF